MSATFGKIEERATIGQPAKIGNRKLNVNVNEDFLVHTLCSNILRCRAFIKTVAVNVLS